MGDLSSNEAAATTKIVGSDIDGLETYTVRATPNQELGSVDTVNTVAVSSTIILTTTPQELKVGGSRLANRKYIWMQALDSNIKWGFGPLTTACTFDVFKNQLFSFPIGNVPIYAYTTVGTANIAFGEGA